MKRITLILFCLLVLNKQSIAQKIKLTAVKLEWEHFLTSTVVDVNCSDFHKVFRKTILTKKITTLHDMVRIESFTKKFILTDSLKNIDVRGIITFCYGKVEVKYCFDQFGLFQKGQKFYSNPKLMSYIEKKLYPKGFY